MLSILLLSLFLCTSSLLPAEQVKVSIFFNPFKPFICLFNIGIEYQFHPKYSINLFTEYIGFSTNYLEKIKHPDFIASAGFRYYPVAKELDEPGFYFGISPCYIYTKKSNDQKIACLALRCASVGRLSPLTAIMPVAFRSSYFVPPCDCLRTACVSLVLLLQIVNKYSYARCEI